MNLRIYRKLKDGNDVMFPMTDINIKNGEEFLFLIQASLKAFLKNLNEWESLPKEVTIFLKDAS